MAYKEPLGPAFILEITFSYFPSYNNFLILVKKFHFSNYTHFSIYTSSSICLSIFMTARLLDYESIAHPSC